VNNLVDAMDALRAALQTEITLRQAANNEWKDNIHGGPMKVAHDAAIEQVVKLAKVLANLS